jgi:MFS family permease
MTANLRVLLTISVLFGITAGVYESAYPLLLDAWRVDTRLMGLIFACAGVAVLAARIYMGGLSDRWGRKALYGWALAVVGVATAAIATISALPWQLALRTLRDTAALTRETIHPIVVYEERASGFLDRIGKFRGWEFTMLAFGTLLVYTLLWCFPGHAMTAYQLALYISGGLVVVAALWLALRFKEHPREAPAQAVTLRDLFNFDMHPNLKVLTITGVIFAIGVQLSHSFYLPLFFTKTFGADPRTVMIITIVHRVSLGVPMFFVGRLRIKNFQAWYIGSLIVEGVVTAVAAVIPHFGASTAVFLLHDALGAAIWTPIQATLIQQYSRPESRGLEVGKVLAWGGLGAIIGPLSAGYLGHADPRLPFLISGIVMALAAVPLLWLNQHAPAPAAVAETA